MNTYCDENSKKIFKSIVGENVAEVYMCPYQGYFAYSEILIKLSTGICVRISLREVGFSKKMDVFVIQAEIVEEIKKPSGWDGLQLSSFIVKEMFLIRHDEWLEQTEYLDSNLIGKNAMEQKFGFSENTDFADHIASVDGGICFVGHKGAELSINADTFPLVFQLQYIVAPSKLQTCKRVAI